MASTFSPNVNLELPGHGDFVDSWDSPVNADWTAIDAVFGNTTSLNAVAASGTVALTVTQYRPRNIIITGLLTANVNYQLPTAVGGTWSVFNNTTGAFSITFSSAGGGTSVVIPQTARGFVVSDGTNVGLAQPAGGSTKYVQYNSGGFFAGNANLQFDPATNYLTVFAITTNAPVLLNPASSLSTIENANGSAQQICYSGSNSLVAAQDIRLNSTAPQYVQYTSSAGQAGAIVPNGTGAITLVTTSDARRKTVINEYDPGDIFDRIVIYNFDWDTGERDFGPLAQELYTVAPNLVRKGDDNADLKVGDEGFEAWMVSMSPTEKMLCAEVKRLRARLLAGNL